MATTTTSILEPAPAVNTSTRNDHNAPHGNGNRQHSLSAALEIEPAMSLSMPRTIAGQPQEMLDVEEPITASGSASDEDVIYPSGAKLWAIMVSTLMVSALFGLDATVVAVAVPSITNHFKTIGDIGWYLAAYGLAGSALTFFWSKAYTVYPIKSVFISSLLTFECGSLLATAAPTSSIFIVGRALSGCGAAGINIGKNCILTHSFPNSKRPAMISIVAFVGTAASVSAPLVGGALIDALSWRACFGINLPLGAVALALTWFSFQSPRPSVSDALTWRQKALKLDPVGTLVFIPAITCLLLALQWGGMTFGWGDARIIVLFVLFAVLSAVFGWLQYRAGEDAVLPLRVLRNRNVLGATFFESCVEGALVLTEYYISIYFQGVKGFSAFKSGYLGVPMIIGLSVAVLVSGTGTSAIGYYMPFMYASAILGPIASGLLTTLDLDSQLSKAVALLAFLGAAIGIGLAGPAAALTTVLPVADVPIGLGISGFGIRLTKSLFVSVAATLFQDRLKDDLGADAAALIGQNGLSDIRRLIGPERLRQVLTGYGDAVSQTLYMPTALMTLTVAGAAVMEWRSVKKKYE